MTRIVQRAMELSRKQVEFLELDADIRLMCGGRGSGKTEAGARCAFREAVFDSAGLPGLIGANSYKQLNGGTLPKFCATLDEYAVPWVFNKAPPATWGHSRFNKHDDILTVRTRIGLSQIHCRSLENFNDLRSLEFGWAWLDETRDTKKEAFDVLIACLRGCPASHRYRVFVTTTPNGFNWLYDVFVGAKRLPGARVIQATSFDNAFLPKQYVHSLLAKYSKKVAQQEVYGKFVGLAEGQAFDFDRTIHVDAGRGLCEYRPDLPLVHTWDFNVNPLCSCIGHKVDDTIRTIDEIHIDASARVWDATEEFIRRYGKHKGRIDVFGDSSGRNQDVGSAYDKFHLIETAYRGHFGDHRVNICPNYGNPPVFDSVQSVNCLLSPAAGPVRLFFHERCEQTIIDMEQVSFLPGTRVLDKSDEDKGRVHHSDALRYWVHQEFPAAIGELQGFTP